MDERTRPAQSPAGGPQGEPEASPPGESLSMAAILEGIGEGFFALGRDWRFTAFNRAAEEMFEISRGAVIGRTLWEVSPGVVGGELERRYRRVMDERIKQGWRSTRSGDPTAGMKWRSFRSPRGSGSRFATPPTACA